MSLSCISVLFVKLYILVDLFSVGIDVCLIREEGNDVLFAILAGVCGVVTSISVDTDFVLSSFKVGVAIDVFPVSKIDVPTIVFDSICDEDIDSLFVEEIDSILDEDIDSLFVEDIDSLFVENIDSLFVEDID